MLLGQLLVVGFILNLVYVIKCDSSSSTFNGQVNQLKLSSSSLFGNLNYYDGSQLTNGNSNNNITQLLINRFHYLFKNLVINQDGSSMVSEMVKSVAQQFDFGASSSSYNNNQSALEDRKIEQQDKSSAIEASTSSSSDSNEEPTKNYFRIFDKVFSREVLPDVYKSTKAKGAHCGPFIGCIEVLPNFPALLKKANISSTFTIYTASNPRQGHKILYEPLTHYQLQDNHLNEIELSERLRMFQQQQNQNQQSHNPQPSLAQQSIHLHLHHHHHHHQMRNHARSPIAKQQHQILQQQLHQRNTAISWRSAVKIVHSQEYPFDMASIEQSGFNASANTRIIIGGYFAKEDEEWIDEVVRQWMILEPAGNVIKVSWADANRGLYHTAAYNSRIVGRQLSLFLHYLDQIHHINLNKFHLVGHSLGAHIAGFVGSDNDGKIARITGLDPAGPIFVELNTSMRLDPTDAKFVDVMHTNGGTITKGSLGLSLPSGHVDYYCNGGSIQPGCYFSSVTKSIMDPVERIACNHRRSYRYFIEIIRMTIRASDYSLDTSIHVATPNSSPTTEVPTTPESSQADNDIKMSSREENSESICNQCDNSLIGIDAPPPLTTTPPPSTTTTQQQQQYQQMVYDSALSQLPSAFLFEAKQDDLVRLMQPEILIMRRDASELSSFPPAKRFIEFHQINPDFPPGKRGMYFFRTRSEAPFFGTKQYALTLKTDSVIRRKIAITAKINQTLIAEAEIDEIPGSYSLIFVPNDMKLMQPNSESQVPPPLQLMWRYRSFNLLLNQQNELHLSGLELSLLENPQATQQVNVVTSADALAAQQLQRTFGTGNSNIEPIPIVRYSTGQTEGILGTGSVGGGLLKGGFSGHLTLTRNQWHKFEGKPIK